MKDPNEEALEELQQTAKGRLSIVMSSFLRLSREMSPIEIAYFIEQFIDSQDFAVFVIDHLTESGVAMIVGGFDGKVQ